MSGIRLTYTNPPMNTKDASCGRALGNRRNNYHEGMAPMGSSMNLSSGRVSSSSTRSPTANLSAFRTQK